MKRVSPHLTTKSASVLAMFPLVLAAPLWGAAPSPKQQAETRRLMHEYARCVVKGNRDIASEAIISNADNGTILRRYPSLIDGDCLGRVAGDVKMTFGGDLYRYALADALVNEAFAAGGETSFADRLPLAHLPAPTQAEMDSELAKVKNSRKRSELQETLERRQAVAWLSRYGECIARDNPLKARLWLLTPPGGPEEISRINDLRPSFAICLKDGTITFNRITMRGTVAINYYRLAMATRVAGAVPHA